MQAISKYKLTFNIIIIIYVVSLPVGMLKIYRIENLAFIYINFFYISMIFLTALFLYKCLKLRKVNVDIVTSVLFVILSYGILIGLINGNSLEYLIIDSGRIVFVLLAYLWIYNTEIHWTDMNLFIQKLSQYLIIVYTVIIFFSYLIALPIGLISYFSIASQRLIIPVCYYFRKKPLLSLYSFILILLSGKRGAAVSILLLLAIYWIIKKIKEIHKIKRPTWRFVGILLIVVFMISSISIYNVDALTNRWKYFDPRSEDFNLKIGSSGRFEEVLGVISSMKNDGISYWLGAGNGYTYRLEYKVGSETYIYNDYRNVHISMVNVFMLYGLLFTSGLYFLILHKIRKASKFKFRMPNNKQELFSNILMIILGLFIYTFFAYELFQEILIWIFLAFINQKLIIQKSVLRLELNLKRGS